MNVNVYDFDNTIYHGESTFDFALYVIMRRKRLLKKIPSKELKQYLIDNTFLENVNLNIDMLKSDKKP